MFTENTSEKTVHVVAFDIPVPVNYGGAIDIYYKLKAFRKENIRVHLHCYQYGRNPAPELESLCASVHYYRRNISKPPLFQKKPYIVVTRASEELMENLLKDQHPILFEGLHTCYFLDDARLKDRHKIVRTHNIEHDYYTCLGKVEKNIFRKYYFLNEASKLKKFENVLKHAGGIAAISNNDLSYFIRKFCNVKNISAFHPNDKVKIHEGMGSFALYHGSLEVGENNEAALFLVTRVFNDLGIPLVIAGNKPSGTLKETARLNPNVEIRSNITTEEIYGLIANAHINILPTFQATGIKLKLLAALFNGRHCIVNTPMIEKTGLGDLCSVADTAEQMKQEVLRLMERPFTEADINKRKDVLMVNGFTNNYNMEQLLRMLFPR